MTLSEFQRLAMRTAGEISLTAAALGLAGEAGEFCDYLKKVLFHKHKPDRSKAIKELGDVLWYVALGAEALGISLENVAQINIEKLEARYPAGFSRERSINREV